jgi:four helix bundle protein
MDDNQEPARGAHSVWELQVFRRAYEAALEAHRFALTFPKYEQYDLASQLRRSSKSICANLMEGRGRQQGSSAEFRRFVLMALGSADESSLWCRFALDLGYLQREEAERLQNEFREIAKMLNALAAKLK